MKYILNILLALTLFSCTQEAANIEYHLDDFYGNSEAKDNYAVLDTGEEVVGPESIAPSDSYKVDKYQQPESIQIDEMDNIDADSKHKKEERAEIVYKRSSKSSSSKVINVSEQTHMVSRGETLYAISRKYNIPILPIIIVNKLSPPYELSMGQKIRIPEARFHVVEPKETLYSISRKYGVDMSALVRANRLQPPYQIEIGEKLQVPFPTYRPKPGFKASEETQVASEEEQKEQDEVDLETSDAEVLKPKGLSIMIPPTLKPVQQRAPSYKTALLRKELARKKKTVYKDDGKFMWPTNGKLIGKFGVQKNNEYNDGIYIAAPAGAYVRASLSGKVVYIGDSLKSYGNLVIIKHNNGLLTAYAHLSKIDISKDEYVKKGQQIGTIGQTGKVKSPQLYFAIRRGKEARDPMMYLRQ